MVEAWFGLLTRKSLRRGSVDTVRALIRHIEAFITEWNSHPTPFVWSTDRPRRHRLGLYFDLQVRNITASRSSCFSASCSVTSEVRSSCCWMAGQIDRRRDFRAFLQRRRRVEVHRVPRYAPELNSGEFVWTQAKRESSNIDHDGLVPLTLHVVRSLQRIGRSHALLRSCIRTSDLPWP